MKSLSAVLARAWFLANQTSDDVNEAQDDNRMKNMEQTCADLKRRITHWMPLPEPPTR